MGEPFGSMVARSLNELLSKNLPSSAKSTSAGRMWQRHLYHVRAGLPKGQVRIAKAVIEIITALRSKDLVMLDRIFRRYGLRPIAAWDRSGNGPVVLLRFPGGNAKASLMLGALFELARERALISRLRVCDYCGKWFFAHHEQQRFCHGGKCREAARAQDERYAEEHRQRMKQRYWDIKLGKAKARTRKRTGELK